MREISDLKRMYNPSMIVLIEPKINGAGATEVCRRIRKSHWIISEANGFSGGVWFLWNEESIKIELLNIHKSIDVAVKMPDRGN